MRWRGAGHEPGLDLDAGAVGGRADHLVQIPRYSGRARALVGVHPGVHPGCDPAKRGAPGIGFGFGLGLGLGLGLALWCTVTCLGLVVHGPAPAPVEVNVTARTAAATTSSRARRHCPRKERVAGWLLGYVAGRRHGTGIGVVVVGPSLYFRIGAYLGCLVRTGATRRLGPPTTSGGRAESRHVTPGGPPTRCRQCQPVATGLLAPRWPVCDQCEVRRALVSRLSATDFYLRATRSGLAEVAAMVRVQDRG